MSNPTLATLTPEHIAHLMRLEAIFMPEARRQRDAKMARDNPGNVPEAEQRMRFAHYTSAEAAIKIIATKRLWMRSTTCMNDYQEVEHGYNILLRFFSNDDNKRRFLEAANACNQGAGQDAVAQFDSWWRQIRFNTYITSVSDHLEEEKNVGRLSMWRAFGANQPRVALVLSVPLFSNLASSLGVLFSPVAYLQEQKAHTILNEVVANMIAHRDFLSALSRQELVLWIFQMLLIGVTCVKHDAFKEELEWRGVYMPQLTPSPLVESSIEIIQGVPQRVQKIPFDQGASPALASLDLANSLERIIIGPTAYPWVMYEAFVEVLSKAGVPNAGERVVTAAIPLRP